MNQVLFFYIDPGTGAMLFSILIGIVTTLYFVLQRVWIRAKSFVKSGGKITHIEDARRMPFVIFSDDKRYWNVFQPLCDAFEARKIPLVYWTCSPDDPALKAEYEYVKAECIGEINRAVTRLNVMKADICIATTPGLDVYQWKRSKNCSWYVHVFHAVGDATIYRMFGLDFFDCVTLTGQYQVEQIRKLEKLRNLPAKDLEVVGLTYLDEMLKRKEQTPRPVNDRLTVLLAPSWGASSILVKYGEKVIESLLATGYKVIIRPHPQSATSDKAVIDPMKEKYPDSDDLTWNYDNDNFDVLNEADIMISDFSGVIFDFILVFDKPLIYADTSFDKSPYDAAWLEEEPWVFGILPQVGVPLTEEDLPRMKDVIDAAVKSEELNEGRMLARAQAWEHIGESTERTMAYLLDKQKELTSKELQEEEKAS